MVVAPVPPREGAAVKSKSGLPVVTTVALDDPHAATLHQQFAIGFSGEVLRTDYLAKQLVREIEVGGRRYADGPRAAAREPTVLIMGGARAAGPTSRGVALKGTFGARTNIPTRWRSRWMPIPTTIVRCRRRWRGRSGCWPRRGWPAPTRPTPRIRW